jgi:hypothetical protein
MKRSALNSQCLSFTSTHQDFLLLIKNTFFLAIDVNKFKKLLESVAGEFCNKISFFPLKKQYSRKKIVYVNLQNENFVCRIALEGRNVIYHQASKTPFLLTLAI